MSDKSQADASEVTSVTGKIVEETANEQPPPAPHSWISTGLGLCVALFFGMAVLALFPKYIASRPLDLRAASQTAAAALEERLLVNRVPPESIRRKGPVLIKNRDAYLYFYEYEIDLPGFMELAIAEKLVEKAVLSLGVSVMDLIDDGVKSGLSLHLANQTFTTMRMRSSTLRVARAPATASPARMEPSKMYSPADVLASRDVDVVSRTWSPPRKREPVIAVAEPIVITEPIPSPPEAVSTEPRRSRLAIIIDDGGYGGPTTEAILSLDPRLTLAVLPYTPYGEETSRRAIERGFEVILHMPMENISPRLRHDGQIETEMTPEEIAELTRDALSQVPGAVGINNHMGSKYTTDPAAMEVFFNGLADHSLYFVDSRTASDSQAYRVAQEFGIRAAHRDLFLDHENDPEAIRSRFQDMIDETLKHGRNITIAHFRPNTVRILQELLPTLEAQGIELVHVSELVE